MNKRWRCRLMLAVLAAGALVARPLGVRADAVSDKEVVDSIKKGVDFLLNAKNGDHWDPAGQIANGFMDKPIAPGVTALALYALLHVGESIDDDRLADDSKELAPVVKYVINAKLGLTYDAGLKACALAMMNPKAHPDARAAVVSDKEEFLQKMVEIRKEGGYYYTLEKARADPSKFDNSNSQYGVLGMWSAADMGIEVSTKYWQIVEEHWRKGQAADGGWGYNSKTSSPAMSVAGLASLYVTTEFTDDSPPQLEPRQDKAIDDGLAWVTKNFSADNNLYYLYGVERVGLASGYKFFGTTDWYKTIATNLVGWQNGDGSWTSNFPGGDNHVVATSYALLFLIRGRNPVVFNKLEYKGPWNARPRDDANITRWMSKKFEKPINWQIVNLQVPAEEWLDAPILLITGSKDPNFTKDDIAKLRAFEEAGGIIFSTADGGSARFTELMKKYAGEVMDHKYEFHDVKADDPLFNIYAEVKDPPRIMAMSNGVRDIWVHSTVDMGAAWQRNAIASKNMWIIPSNLYFYATGKGSLRSKLQTLVVDARGNSSRTIHVGRLEYPGNWNPEPGAWRRFTQLALANFSTTLNVTTVKAEKLDPHDTPVVHMTGTTAFTIPATDLAKLKAYIDGGGTLLADAGGGNEEFNKSFRSMVSTMYPKAVEEPVRPGDALLSDSVQDAVKITTVDYRKFDNLAQGHKEHSVKLEGIKLNNRWAIVLSPEDISSGFLGTNTWGILGYAPQSAELVMRNLLLHLGQDSTQAAQ